MPRLTSADLAEWRRLLAEEGTDDLMDPDVAQQLVPRLMAEVEQLWAELERLRSQARERAA